MNKCTENEQAFLDTINAQKRSLCLLEVKAMYPYITNWNGSIKPKIKFDGVTFNLDNLLTNNNDYIIKDCKWVRLVFGQ